MIQSQNINDTVTKVGKSQSGFSLIELMFTVLIAAILVALAAPSFQLLIANNRMTKASNEYSTAFRLARTTAISKSLATFVCPSANAGTAAPTCGGAAAWTNGLLVFSKPPGTAVAGVGNFNAATDTLLLQTDLGTNTANSITVGTSGTPGNFLGFLNNGFTWQAVAGGTATPTFVVCDADRQEERGRAFSFSIAGRMTTQDTDAANAAIPDCNG